MPTAQCSAQESTHLSSTTVTNKHELEGGNVAGCGSFGHDCGFVVVAGCLRCTAQRLQKILLAEVVVVAAQ
jgi:hypothetical protein